MMDLLVKNMNEMWNNYGCGYFMFTSARNLYNTQLIPTAVDKINEGIDLIGWEYVAQKYVTNRDDPEKSHRPGYGQQIYTQFRPGYIEHCGAIIKRSTFASKNMSFVLRFMDSEGQYTADFNRKTADGESLVHTDEPIAYMLTDCLWH